MGCPLPSQRAIKDRVGLVLDVEICLYIGLKNKSAATASDSVAAGGEGLVAPLVVHN